jgi:nicotinamide-nucleotide amidase
VVTTGGLGPTVDDLTRHGIADALGLALVESPQAEACVREHLGRHGIHDPSPSQMTQALVPEGAQVLYNRLGSAAGFVCRVGGGLVAALPGVPSEMRAMTVEKLVPVVRSAFPALPAICRRVVGVARRPESHVNEAVRDLMEAPAGPRVGVMCSPGVVRIVVTASADSPQRAESAAERVVGEIASRLGESVFTTRGESLAEVLGGRLGASGLTLSLAESCTGGLIGQLVTSVPGSSGWFRGGVVAYSNEAKRGLLGVPARLIESEGAVSGPVAEAMALGARRAFGSDYGLAVTGIAGPAGGTADKPVGLVYAALAGPAGARGQAGRGGPSAATSHEWRFSGTRETIRDRTAAYALDICRLAVVI